MSLWLIALLAGVAAGAAAAGVILQRRQRRQLAALARRLDQLESHWIVASPAPELGAADRCEAVLPALGEAGEPAVGAPAEDESSPSGGPSADVLAGLTSHVQALLAQGGGGVELLADRAILAIYRRLAEPLSPSTLANSLYVSLRTLERGLAVALGCTPGELIATVRMREARRLLREGCRVSTVADRLGFANPFHFSRRFKRFYGVAPSEARQLEPLSSGRSG